MIKGGYREASSGFTISASQRGFTIVEVLIVLAVSGVMFIAAATMINGRQNKTEFTTAINDLQQELQQTVNETASGYYPNKGNFTCNSSTTPVSFTPIGGQQGANGGCIFLGKAIQFGLNGNNSALGVLPLVGSQYQAGIPVLTVGQASPRAVYPGTGETNVPAGPKFVPDTSTTVFMENGLTVANSSSACDTGQGGMCYIDSGGTHAKLTTGIIAFVAGDTQGNITSLDGSGNLQAGSEQLSLYAVSGSASNLSLGQATDAIDNSNSPYSNKLALAASATICVASATTNQSGLISIDSGLNVTLSLRTGLTC